MYMVRARGIFTYKFPAHQAPCFSITLRYPDILLSTLNPFNNCSIERT